MKICVFDTETTSLDKPFVYDIGYIIYDTDTNISLVKRSFVVEQVWHNLELFSSAYYASKRPLYIAGMRSRAIILEKFGYITQQMCRDFKAYDVQGAYAYNSDFDEKVFAYNCDWFKCINPFDTIPIFDIRGYVHKKIAFSDPYQKWAEANEAFTESRNYSTTAENVYRFLTGDDNFEEAHTALADAEIELEILLYCTSRGLAYNVAYKVYRSIVRRVARTLEIRKVDGSTIELPYNSITVYAEKGDRKRIILKNK